MLGRGAIGIGVPLLCLGCNPEATLELSFDRSQAPNALSMILAFEELPSLGGRYSTLLAIDLAEGAALPNLPHVEAMPEDGGAEAIALFLSQDLASIGLTSGPLPEPPGESTDIGDLAAASFAGAQSLHVEPGDTEVVRSTLETPSQLPSRFLATEVDADCAKFEAMNGRVNVCRNFAFSTRIGPAQFLFGTRCQRFFRATVEGSRVTVEAIDSPLGGRAPDADQTVCSAEGRSPNTPGFVPKSPAIHSARSDAEGSIAYGGLGEIYIDELGRPRVTIPLPEVAGESGEERGVFWLTGEPKLSTEGFELFAMTAKGRVLRISKTGTVAGAEVIHDFAFGVTEDEGFGGLASSAPGRVVAVAPRSSRVFVYDHPVGRIVEGPPGMGFASAAVVPRIGTIVSAEGGFVFRVHENGESPSLEAYPEPKDWRSRIEAIGAFRDGFLIGGTNGFIGEYREGRGYCVTQQLASATPRALYAIGPPGQEHAVFVVSGKTQSQDLTTYGLLLSR